MKGRFILLCLFAICLLSSCMIGAGTHGYIKGYKYHVPKPNLQQAVMYVIQHNTTIYRDTSLDDSTSAKRDTVSNYYNDIENYVSIKIFDSIGECSYTFKYGGGPEQWKEGSSSIYIVYAYDENGKGGSAGGGEVTKRTPELKRKLTELFENEFVSKVDKRLGMGHEDID